MPLRVAFWLIFVTVGCIWMFRRPLVGVCLVLLLFPLNPSYFGLGLETIRFTLIATLCLIAAFITNPPPLVSTSRPVGKLSLWLFALFCIWSLVGTAWAYNRPMAIDMAVVMVKHFIFVCLIARIIVTEDDLKAVMWTLLISFGLKAYFGRWGYKYGVASDLQVGFLGSVLVMLLPSMFFLVVSSKKKWQWGAGILAAPFILDYIVFRSQRSAFMSLVVAGALIILFAPRRLRWRVRILGAAAAVFFVTYLTPPGYWTRMETILDPHSEASAQSRFILNQVSMEIYKLNPLGVGLGNYQYVSGRYTMGAGGLVAHNSLLSILVEAGWPGMALWVMMAALTWVKFFRVARRSPPEALTGRVAKGFCIGMLAVLPAMWTHTEHLADYYYWLVGLAIATDRISLTVPQRQLAAVPERAAPARGARRRSVPATC